MDGFPSTISQAKVTVYRFVPAKLTFYLPEYRAIFPYDVKGNWRPVERE